MMMMSKTSTVYERCAGVIVLRGKEVLLLRRKKGHYDTPKGHIEPGENEVETAVRELREESGIGASLLSFVDGFRESIAYQRAPGIRKHVVYYAVRVPDAAEVVPDQIMGPVLGHAWMPLHRAIRAATCPHSRELLRRLRRFVNQQE